MITKYLMSSIVGGFCIWKTQEMCIKYYSLGTSEISYRRGSEEGGLSQEVPMGSCSVTVRYQILSLSLRPALPSHPFPLYPSSFLYTSLSLTPLLPSLPLIRGGGGQEHPLRHNPFSFSLKGSNYLMNSTSNLCLWFLFSVSSSILSPNFQVYRTHSHRCSCSLSSRKLHQFIPPLRGGAYSFTPSESGWGGLWLLWLTEYNECDTVELWRLGFKSPCSFHLGLLEHYL